jgi:UDPglucose--hexose-1-phosphate uridylyltransferase
MSELRHDPMNRRWVIIAADRAQRPTQFELLPDPPENVEECPFCEGHEDRTPPEIYAVRPSKSPPNGPGWSVRVVPNRYPALAIEGQPDRRGVGMYDRMHGIGAHEVIVESPSHQIAFADQPLDQIKRIVEVWRGRIVDLMRDSRFKYVLLFKNQGVAAGASLSHPHAQIIATPVTPRAVGMELDAAHSHHLLKERCLLCDLITQEIEDGRRLVLLNDDFVAYTPYASRFPFEIMLAPRQHLFEFGLTPDSLIAPLASALAEILTRLKLLLRDPPYNFSIHTAPNTNVRPRRAGYFATLEWDWHWHIEILPRLTRVAGFEWGTGFHINPTAPEDAAALLREVEVPR